MTARACCAASLLVSAIGCEDGADYGAQPAPSTSNGERVLGPPPDAETPSDTDHADAAPVPQNSPPSRDGDEGYRAQTPDSSPKRDESDAHSPMPPPALQDEFDGGNPPSEVDAGVSSPVIEHVSVLANDFTFEVHVSGPADGEPVLLLHGFGAMSLSWISQINAFASAGYRVVAPDLRGYSPGARPTDVGDYFLPLFADDILALADHFEFVRFHLVGHDVGSAVGWLTAAMAPDRVASFAPLSVPHPNAVAWQYWDPDSCQTQASSYVDTLTADNAEELLLADDAAYLRKLYTDTELHGDEILPPKEIDDRVAFFRTEGTLTGALNWYRANAPFRWFPVAPTVSVPVLFVWGDDDFAICRESAESCRDFVTGPYRFEVFAGHGHWLPEFGGARLNELLLEHLRAYPIAR